MPGFQRAAAVQRQGFSGDIDTREVARCKAQQAQGRAIGHSRAIARARRAQGAVAADGQQAGIDAGQTAVGIIAGERDRAPGRAVRPARALNGQTVVHDTRGNRASKDAPRNLNTGGQAL